MIPKIIHYCSFGHNKPSFIQEMCMDSWKNQLPDYEFILWDEANSDMEHSFVKFAYERKKFAFVADYVRLKAVYDYGGIYLDTDMYLHKDLNGLLAEECFFGAQDLSLINAAIFGAQKNNEFIKNCLVYYNEKEPQDWQLRLAIPRVLTRALAFYLDIEKLDLSKTIKEKGLIIYSQEYFYPLPFDVNKPFKKDFQKYATDKTIAIHLWEGSWIDYDVFQLIRRRDYFLALHKIDFNKNGGIGFFKKCISALIYSIKN